MKPQRINCLVTLWRKKGELKEFVLNFQLKFIILTLIKIMDKYKKCDSTSRMSKLDMHLQVHYTEYNRNKP